MKKEAAAGARWKCVVAYDGGLFSGWQSQPDGNAVQDVIERRLAGIFSRPVRIHGSGRTDAGVHARGQVFHFDGEWGHGAERLLAALRAGLPPTIQVRSARRVAGDFHARFSARGKVYHYGIFNGGFAGPFEQAFCWSVPRRLDVAAMREAAACLEGRHDFRGFSARGKHEPASTVRELRRLEVTERGRRLRIVAEADGFLYKMVRSLAGALAAVGSGALTAGRLRELLESGERDRLVETAPARGLCLWRVIYGDAEPTT
ncbi:MAG: tRNA pseudouridine(38-40) synthase TruA, partial [Opitutaceae bacterium]|nr:tRNA pseudouridine(38-40) synthase TruA [Opitutaceae bacterium]